MELRFLFRVVGLCALSFLFFVVFLKLQLTGSEEWIEANHKYLLHTRQVQVEARDSLKLAVLSNNRNQNCEAIDTEEELDLRINVKVKAKAFLCDFKDETEKAGASVVVILPRTKLLSDLAGKERRKERQEIANKARFMEKNFPNLRTADDFARGAILNKNKVGDSHL